jgi:hypothetical protein
VETLSGPIPFIFITTLETGRTRSGTHRLATRRELIVAVIRTLAVVIALVGIALAAAQGAEGAPPPWATGTYSSFAFNQESGDLNGLEVRIILTRKGMKGVVQFAEGGAGDVSLVDVSVAGGRVHFEMPRGSNPEGVFDGTVSPAGLEGTFTYAGGATVRVKLARTASYWDRHK